MPENHSDVLVLGGGSGGYSCAIRSAQLGLSVIVVEEDKLGGTCLHRGCIPTKALLHSAEAADTVRHSEQFGVRSVLGGIDMPAVHEYKRSTVQRLYAGLEGLLKRHDVTVVHGRGLYRGDRTVAVGNQDYTGSSLVVATGSAPRSIPGIELGPRIATSDQALELAETPERVVVLGGGVIGLEFASIWRSFGAEVTIVEALPRLASAEDPWSSAAVERAYRKRGITVRTSVSVVSATETHDHVHIVLDNGDTLAADLLLVAVGRSPRVDGLRLTEHGIEIDRGFVSTNESLQTSVPGVYAVGDVVRGLQLAHRGFQQGIFVAEHIAGHDPHPGDESSIPRITYSHPEIASVGLTEGSAREQYGDIDVATYDLAGNGKSQILKTAGGVKVIRVAGGPIVGVHMVGDRVGELVGEAQLLVAWEAVPEDVAPFVHAHPTQNEALGEALMVLGGKPLHAHR
ncbi:dihydrolipoyl dehydrogenase [Rhodococcus qingshengii]|uniref:dihydrolipoyl dehydrogenase n=1 Tax=Rhodococcus qingshengii TaxID=334542 RepID=UPI001BECDDA6|nr:dihydrolipoyl dehydrogenase [Rhodococcus qingshengii]MBT2271375.1 dihydrolipoyl dehydrogenase [Rhodococcus qingshengii]